MKKKKPQVAKRPRQLVQDANYSITAKPSANNENAQSRQISVIGKLASSRPDYIETVLYIATNASQIEMACLMAEQSDFNSVIYSDGYDFHDCSMNYSKARFCNTLKNVAALFKHVTKVVTYIGQINPNIKKDYRLVLSSALKLGIPVIELPHGLIQSGYNLDDSSRVIDLSSYYDGIGDNLPSIASMRLAWYGRNSVGYPRFTDAKKPQRLLPAYTVITTNTNWFLYSVEEKRRFFNIVWRFAEANPEKLFIWSPHPAENNQHTYSHSISALRPANVLRYGLKQDIYFDGIENTNDLIAYCESGISTVSTCLLEFEMYEKAVSVFRGVGVSNLIDSFLSAKTFTSTEDLRERAERIHTGMLEKYEPRKFDIFLASAPPSNAKNSIYLDMV
ncbi:hypothetical protein [Pseudomonas sp. FYR_7]|uniref:hypothetical protein n=1 Tax=Pseudomonas sp. FYR_7 TaxID=3367174 RepID=UPI00370C5B03